MVVPSGYIACWIALMLASCAAGKESAGDTIAFTVNRDGFGEIWIMDADGANQVQLTESGTPEYDASGSHSPDWSPEGTLIAYASSGDAVEEDPRDHEIYVMRSDGTEKRRLTNDGIPDGTPAWSPDGERIAFSHAPGSGTEEARGVIVVMDADGGDRGEITDPSDTDGVVYDALPAWSPDGSLIAYTRATLTEAGKASVAIWTVDAGGGGERLLLENASEPAWSPEGNRIAFTTTRDRFGETCFHECGPSREIYVADEDGTNLRRLTTSRASDHSPAWSPDGEQIVFTSDRSDPDAHENELYVMNAEGGDVRRLTSNDVWDLEPDWR